MPNSARFSARHEGLPDIAAVKGRFDDAERRGAGLPRLASLRQQIACIEGEAMPVHDTFTLGALSLDQALGGLSRGSNHEIHARTSDHAAAAAGFAMGAALLAAAGRHIVWVRQDCLDGETGRLHAPGLMEFGLDPDRLVLVEARDGKNALKAGFEALTCASLGAVILELFGHPKALDLTAGRKLLLAARRTGVTLFTVHVSAREQPSPAETRWAVAPGPSRALEANAPGAPHFAIDLLRHRAGFPACRWLVEWDRDNCSFNDRFADRFADRFLAEPAGLLAPDAQRASLSGTVVSFPSYRSVATEWRDQERRRLVQAFNRR